MALRFFLLAIIFLFISCSDVERNNPYDSGGSNYQGKLLSSSSSKVSSPSVKFSSSSSATYSSSIVQSSSSYIVQTGTFTDSRDGKSYKWVKIGTQIWMAENLNYITNGYKCYNNEPVNCSKYGRLYDKETVKDICPKGWHLPSRAEWNTLASYIEDDKGCSSCNAKHLKATSGWNSGGNGLDSYGFTALPGGYGYSDGSFGLIGDCGYWWSSTVSNTYYRYMSSNNEDAIWQITNGNYFYSVRCIQD